jgi:hypothetical protein
MKQKSLLFTTFKQEKFDKGLFQFKKGNIETFYQSAKVSKVEAY